MSNIIPSTKLKVITVHKLWDTTCMRCYFWTRIMNFESKRINMNFWYGGVLGAGWEAFLLGKTWKQIVKVMNQESLKRSRRHILTPEDMAEMVFQMQLISLFIKAAMQQRRNDFFANKMHMTESQQVVTYPLEYSDVTYCGTNEGLGTYRNNNCMYEIKTAGYVNNDYLSKIAFDMQIHAYHNALVKSGYSAPKRCQYLIFVKTKKKIKRASQGQTSEMFLREIERDIAADPKHFFINHEHRFGSAMLRQVEADIEAAAWRLSLMYDQMSEAELLNPNNWDRQSQMCLHYGACPYLMLCNNLQSWKVCERMFQQREMLYKEEKEELQK